MKFVLERTFLYLCPHEERGVAYIDRLAGTELPEVSGKCLFVGKA